MPIRIGSYVVSACDTRIIVGRVLELDRGAAEVIWPNGSVTGEAVSELTEVSVAVAGADTARVPDVDAVMRMLLQDPAPADPTPYVSPFAYDPDYARKCAEASVCVEMEEALATLMKDQNVTRKELARRLRVKPKHVKRLLRNALDNARLFVAAFHTLGGVVHLDLAWPWPAVPVQAPEPDQTPAPFPGESQ